MRIHKWIAWKWIVPLVIIGVVFTCSGLRQAIFQQKQQIYQASILNNLFHEIEQIRNASVGNKSSLDPFTASRKDLKDPFNPLNLDSGRNANANKNNLLQGIVIQKNRASAIIAGRRLSVGDKIFGMRLITIRENKVVLANNHKIRILSLF